MNFKELANKRQSTRKYADKIVEKEKLLSICDVARLAPSSCNGQPWKLHIYTNESKEIEELRKACQFFGLNKFLNEVNAFIVVEQVDSNVTGKFGSSLTKNDLISIDLGILTSYITLQAEEEGLSSCILGAFRKHTINKALNFDDSRTIRIVVAIGYPSEDYPIRKKVRKSLEETVEFH